ncbi:MAG: hypothetical protein QGD94_09130 [Planctomycetia bacterium]|nr:hypothetical protein [Planctomycetia bacterium]
MPASLPTDYEPVRPRHFDVKRIYLAKGSLSTPQRRQFVENICRLYPDAERIECLETPHNRIDLGTRDAIALHRLGKRTLVFGELGSAVRFSEEQGNTCPNYWHFSPYGFCPYGCKYCYLAGTPGVWYSPTVKVYVNLEDIIAKINRVANRVATPTAFYLGKLQDGLALDPLTAYSKVLVPFFARHKFARQVLLTKSASACRLLGLEHNGHTILSWSLNPPEVVRDFEANVPVVDKRLDAMRACADRGYPIRAVIMPIIPLRDWEALYTDFVRRLLASVPVQRLTLGGICSYRNALGIMQKKLGDRNEITRNIDERSTTGDGRSRYAPALRIRIYEHLIRAAREVNPDVELALCLEERTVREAVGLQERLGKCNCVL